MVSDALLDLFDARLAAEPDAPIVVSRDASVSLAALDRLARGLAPSIGRSRLVCLQASRPVGFLAGLLGLRRVGATVALLDAGLRMTDVEAAAAGLGCDVLVVASEADDCLVRFEVRRLQAASQIELPRGTDMLRLTSGSTGRPRWVALSTAQVLADNSALTSTFALEARRIVTALPLSHAYGMSIAAIPALASGATLVVPHAAPLAALEAAERLGAEILPTAPAWLATVTRLGAGLSWPRRLSRVISASAPLTASAAARFAEATGVRPGILYGSSETGGICADASGEASLRGTVGVPLPGCNVTIQAEREAEDGVAGRVVVESPATGLGCVPHSEQRFSNGRFVSNDIAAWQGAELVLCGRVDDVINLRGRKVAPASIESVVGLLGGVHDAVALGLPRQSDANRIRLVVACDIGVVTEASVLSWCRANLQDHQVPRSVVLVPELPRSQRGKLSRSELAAMFGETS